ncbi:hypothetical protein NOR51B_2667 [Luminiphilus syltensis NOR5-1B]|uniref:Uncharacterized protein n=2 Tax=Luminiphilus TaxID=1341118 RepID=B8KXJ4_9GAMM|nr:hypothetical protein NOR51B_2667 [Luminiphilus syltensis NOR5-1B]
MMIAAAIVGCSSSNSRCIQREWQWIEETRYFTGGGSAKTNVRRSVCTGWEDVPDDEDSLITDLMTEGDVKSEGH